MSVDQTNQLMQDNYILLEALVQIIETSSDAETVRIATSAVTRTESGLNYIRAHPITL